MILFFPKKGNTKVIDAICCGEMAAEIPKITFEDAAFWGRCPNCNEHITAGRFSEIGKNLTIEYIYNSINIFFNPKFDFLEKTRKHEVRELRQLFVYFCRKFTNGTLHSIGRFAKIDHATVNHCVKVIQNEIETNKIVRKKVEDFTKFINEN